MCYKYIDLYKVYKVKKYLIFILTLLIADDIEKPLKFS